MFNICLNALLRFVFLTFVFGYLWFSLGFIERCIYILYLCVNTYFNMWKVWIPHCPFLIDKIFSVTFPIFFRIRIPIGYQLYMKCSYISKKNSKFFHDGLIFGNLKITKVTKIILVAINYLKGKHLKTNHSYQNVKVLLKSFRAIWKALALSSA